VLRPHAGLGYGHQRGGWSFELGARFLAAGTNPTDYGYGAVAHAELQAARTLAERWTLWLRLRGTFLDQDTHRGLRQANTGGRVLALTPGVSLLLLPGLSLSASAGVPVLTGLFGEQQLGPSWQASLVYAVR
jgi:hypothetical protein